MNKKMKQSEWEREKKRLNENYQHIRERFGHVNVQPLHITTVIRHNKVALVFWVRNLVRGFRQHTKNYDANRKKTTKLQFNQFSLQRNDIHSGFKSSAAMVSFLLFLFQWKERACNKKNMHTQKNSQANAWKQRLYMTWDFTEMSV